MKETVAVGVAETGLTPADENAVMNLIDGFPEGLMASMAHDLLAGKPIEIEGLSGAVARLGARSGVRRRRTIFSPGPGALHQRKPRDVISAEAGSTQAYCVQDSARLRGHDVAGAFYNVQSRELRSNKRRP